SGLHHQRRATAAIQCLVGTAAAQGRRRHDRDPAFAARLGGLVWRGPSGRPGGVTVAGSASALPGTTAATVKVTPYAEFPAKGRATGGVRCHRFLKGADVLVLAWAGPEPARGATEAGSPVDLPLAVGRRDGSGERVRHPLAVVGGTAPRQQTPRQ